MNTNKYNVERAIIAKKSAADDKNPATSIWLKPYVQGQITFCVGQIHRRKPLLKYIWELYYLSSHFYVNNNRGNRAKKYFFFLMKFQMRSFKKNSINSTIIIKNSHS